MKNEFYKYDMSGLDNVYLANGYTWHETPYGKAIQIHGAQTLDHAIMQTLVKQKPSITGKEVKYLRKNFGLSQPDFAKMIGKDTQTVARWEKSGKTSKTTEMLARLLFAGLLDGNQTIQGMTQTLNAIDHAKHARIIATETAGAWVATHEVVA